MWTDEDPDLPDADRSPSKTERKRESAALQDLGMELLELPAERLEKMGLPAELLEAVRQGQSITAHGALQRQRKFIGKLLRRLDAGPIRAALAAVKQEGTEAVRQHHRVERWRDRMLEEGDGAVNDFLAGHPDADRQKLRQLVRDALREQAQGAPPRAARLLFRYLREVLIPVGQGTAAAEFPSD